MFLSGTQDGWVAAPFLLTWLAAPLIAWQASRSPLVAGRLSMSLADARSLRLVARRTWRFFERFVTAEDHMLPPDNFQEDPRPVVAHRTSPTNMGLYLLSVVAARDFGWIGTIDAVERLEATLDTMGRLQGYRGHLFNWYDTRDLRPLEPRYVSSVDSGNLAAHLIALSSACDEWQRSPVLAQKAVSGLGDALDLAREALQVLPDDVRTQAITRHQLEDALDDLDAALWARGMAPEEVSEALEEAVPFAVTLADVAQAMTTDLGADDDTELLYWSNATRHSIESWRRDLLLEPGAVVALQGRIRKLAEIALEMAAAMDFAFLLDEQRRLLSIGYRATDGTLDPSCYDLLASEARLASFVAIAKGDVPARHWFRLGRAVTPIGHGAALISWSGSMFEYLMPSLVMRAPTGSLLEQTNRLIVRRQIRYGESLGLPWGVSESAYNARDLEFTYQYSNFGVPGLGLKRGLSENAVIAPYATALAAMVDPEAAVRNYERLASMGVRGRYGFYEAIDFTASRVPEGTRGAIVQAYMAHHQGMTIVSIANALLDAQMRERFHAEPSVQATELLLQERTPRDVSVAHPRAEEVATAARFLETALPDVRQIHTPHDVTPQVHLLSNGQYAVMVTAAGSGYSHWNDIAVTRWREDTTRDDSGSYIFLRDVESGDVWSAGYQPCAVAPDSYEVAFSEDRAEFIRNDAQITTMLEVIVSPEYDAEVRRVSLTNTGARVRDIEVTSYCELALAPQAADVAHPAFSKLFVQTECVTRLGAVLATRRKRSPGEPEIWVAQHAVVEGEALGTLEIETDRAKFLGRGHEVRAPIAVTDGRRLSNTVGPVLDPAFALRHRVRVPAGATVRIAFWTTIASSRGGVLDLIDKHFDANAFVRASTFAWTQAQVQLRYLGISAADANLFQRLAGYALFADASLRPSSDAIRRGGGGPPGLWSVGISGDLPIVMLRIDAVEDIAIARQLLQAHEYWRMKRLNVDLVILNERAASYVQDLQIALETLQRMSQARLQVATDGVRGNAYILRSDIISAATRDLLLSVSRVVLVGQRGSLSDQLDRPRKRAAPPVRESTRTAPIVESPALGPVPKALEFFNGLGGFAENGREYVIALGPGHVTPAPWINVIANPSFGFHVAAEGSGFTWAMNSRENQLTPWSNDPVADRPGEALYLKDEETGEIWGPTVAPTRDTRAAHSARHGQGYSRFEHDSRGIALDLLMYVPLEDPIKIARLKVRNTSARTRRISVTAYVEWVLGTSRAACAPFIVTELDSATSALFARNPWHTTFGSRIAFMDLGGRQSDWTADRREFLGRHGTLAQPAGLLGDAPLSKRVGAGLDPCGALQRSLEIAPGEMQEVVFFLGQAADVAAARVLIERYRAANLDSVFDAVVAHWDEVLGAVQVKTPDRSMDILLNRWALYQTLVCRMWARSAFYQASGAYGFRDQLQDSMALVVARPQIMREHLLRAAGRQFKEGDVQHWWLPPTGQGVRTHISDDRVWLAYSAAYYLECHRRHRSAR